MPLRLIFCLISVLHLLTDPVVFMANLLSSINSASLQLYSGVPRDTKLSLRIDWYQVQQTEVTVDLAVASTYAVTFGSECWSPSGY